MPHKPENKTRRLLMMAGAIALALPATAVVTGPRLIAPAIERLLNRVKTSSPYGVGEEAAALHQRLFVADLHADPLLWNRNLAQRSRYGHIDLPRLVEGNVGLQVFAAATQVPLGINFERNTADHDLLTPLTIIQGWPRPTWRSFYQRALHQAAKLASLAAQFPQRLLLIKSAADLDELLRRRQTEPALVGALLDLEGVHALEGDLAKLDALYEAGFRMVGLTHFIDNEAGGSAHGVKKGGLTPFGRRVVRRVQERHMVLDLAHAAPRVIDDVLAMTAVPVIASHTGVRGVSDSPRNLSDEHVRGIAASGGLVGIAFFDTAVGSCAVTSIARAIRYVADLAGVAHVALGSDFDGAIVAPFDAAGMALLTEALLNEGFSEADIAKIMGENVLRLFRTLLPPAPG